METETKYNVERWENYCGIYVGVSSFEGSGRYDNPEDANKRAKELALFRKGQKHRVVKVVTTTEVLGEFYTEPWPTKESS
jgi:hypothetical protein